jgi:antitoxin component of MazEF toxin-antitoxin module
MRTRLVKLGDAFAVRIPPSFVEQAGLGKSFHILVEHGEIVLRRYKNPRYGWSKSIKEAVRKHGNELTEDDIAWLNAPLGPLEDAELTTKRRERGRRHGRAS